MKALRLEYELVNGSNGQSFGCLYSAAEYGIATKCERFYLPRTTLAYSDPIAYVGVCHAKSFRWTAAGIAERSLSPNAKRPRRPLITS